MNDKAIDEARLETVFFRILSEYERRFPQALIPRQDCTRQVLGDNVESFPLRLIARYAMISCVDARVGTPTERETAKRIFECIAKRTKRDLRSLLVSKVDESGRSVKDTILRLVPAKMAAKISVENSNVILQMLSEEPEPSGVFVANFPLSHNAFVKIEAGVLVDGELFAFTFGSLFGFQPVMVPSRQELDWDALVGLVIDLARPFLSSVGER